MSRNTREVMTTKEIKNLETETGNEKIRHRNDKPHANL